MRKLLLVGLVVFGLVALGGCGGGEMFSETSFKELEGTRTLRSGSGTMVGANAGNIGERYALTLVEGSMSIVVKDVDDDNTQATCDVSSFTRWEGIDDDGAVLPVNLTHSFIDVDVMRTGDDTFSYMLPGGNPVVVLHGGGARETGTIFTGPVRDFTYDVTYSTSK